MKKATLYARELHKVANLPNRYQGLQVQLGGYIQVWHLGHLIAVVDAEGVLVLLRFNVPPYLIDYLLVQPQPETTCWN